MKVLAVIFLAAVSCDGIPGVVLGMTTDSVHSVSCQTIPSEHNQCGLAGKWKNQLQSVMEITCQDGQVNGRYNTAVGLAQDFYDIAGRYTMAGENMTDTVLSWAVSWNNNVFGNSNSSTAWSGIHYDEEGIIRTQWILTRYKTRPDIWQTSMIGHDEFERIC